MYGAVPGIETTNDIANQGGVSASQPLLEDGHSDDVGSNAVKRHNNLSIANGVVVPVMLNIIGVVLFLRIGWGVGHAGISGVALIFLIGETMALFTVFR